MKGFSIGPFDCPTVALDGAYIATGFPSMTAIAGLVDALTNRCGTPAANAPFAIVVHDLQVHPGRPKPKADSKAEPTEAVERTRGRMRATLLMLDPEDAWLTSQIQDALPGLRFAGSVMQAVGKRPEVRVREFDDLGKALRALAPGHLILDRGDILDRALAIARDPLDALLDVFALQKDDQERWQSAYSFSEDGEFQALLPVSVGYQCLEPLEDATTRSGTRCPTTPHVFAEGIVSVAEARSSRKVSRSANGPAALPAFWSWSSHPDTAVIHLTGRSFAAISSEGIPA
ncbi:hypothetical protein CKO28_06105 [Rhodovibrio sodomensis]|uniref:Type I-F CRISPR-associated protein Csy2 n=1 Tax=Rhodovibrio sodomensis TaxID=1088 RepID=A0ABS1DB61_9PROT|nr:type I-F CRISPR-associated protein Csy2 [Rhodovibrio sodomensis]MBK1667605.1 hypothetical protein [Rhodovibrio sodomensis]